MSTTGFQFTDRDAEILNYVYQLRIATLEHLSALTKRSQKTLERRLPKLRDERYLTRLKPRPNKGLYVIGPKAGRVLVQAGYARAELAGNRPRESEWKDLMIPHALLIASIHSKLLLTSRADSIQLDEWQPNHPRLWDTVQTSVGKLPVRPDAYFVLRDARRPHDEQRQHYFLEADVGTMSHTRIAQKIKAYAAYHRQQRHVAKFGIDYFQVAVVTQTKARADNLRGELYAFMSAAQRRAYHFVPLAELSANALITPPRSSAVLLASESRRAG